MNPLNPQLVFLVAGIARLRRINYMKIIKFTRVAPRLKVENFGPIKQADVTFGDLTVFVGPQAAGIPSFGVDGVL
jgi:hypothetical protein